MQHEKRSAHPAEAAVVIAEPPAIAPVLLGRVLRTASVTDGMGRAERMFAFLDRGVRHSVIRAAWVMLNDARGALIQPHPAMKAHHRQQAFACRSGAGCVRGSWREQRDLTDATADRCRSCRSVLYQPVRQFTGNEAQMIS